MSSNFNFHHVFLDEADKTCARAIHDKCAKRLVGKIRDNPNVPDDLCTGVKGFVTCYNEMEQSPPASNCSRVPDITKKFNDLIKEFSNYLIDEYRAANNTKMCEVDAGSLEGDCYAN